MKLKIFAIGAMLAVVGVTAQAGTFDPDGTGPAPAISLGTLDWGPTSFLALNGITAISAFTASGGACPAGSCNFSVLTQAKLIGTLDPNGAVNTPPGIASNSFEITMIARFGETVTSVSPGLAVFKADTTQPSYIEIYFDATPDAHDLTGFGFNDGRLILTGTLANTPTGLFLITDPTPVVLDQHPPDDYPGQLSVSGTGSNGNVSVNITGQDPTFFISALASLGLQFANISIALPYISVDPADCFDTANGTAIGSTGNLSTCNDLHVLGPYILQAGPGIIPLTGPINGLGIFIPPLLLGDFVAQTDNNSPVSFATPEPGSLALVGLGLLGVAVAFRRKEPSARAA